MASPGNSPQAQGTTVSPGAVSASPAGTSSSASYNSAIPAATVVVGPVVIDDYAANIVDPSDLNGSVFDEFIINSRFEGDGHRYMMGLTSETPFQGSSVAFVQLASKTLLWIADWTVLVKGTMLIPDPDVSIPDWILLDTHYEPAAIATNPDGVTPLYRISGTYVYGHKNPDPKTYRDVSIPRQPWIQNGIYQTTILPSNLSDSLLISQGGGSAGGSAGGNGSAPPAPGIKTPNLSPGDSPQATGDA